jgi:predicted DNA-binding transcriptional regulator YafY
MDLFDRIYCLHRILSQSRYPVPHHDLQEQLECSRATINRIIRDMRDSLGAPIVFDRSAEGYHYVREGERSYELPGLWFNASELHALLAVQRLLAEIQPGLLESHLAPLRERIERILKSRDDSQGDINSRIRILSMASRRVDPAYFPAVADAVLRRKRLHIIYHGRADNKTTERMISPQRLAHYRDNWYLDAWDHTKRALRSFSVDRLRQVQVLDKPAKEISDAKLNDHFASAFGIFAGKPKHTAVLRFTPERSRWVADETWHPRQKGRFDGEHYVLEVPYADHRELVMDILKHGPEVEVLAPETLRAEVVNLLGKALLRQQRIGLEDKRKAPKIEMKQKKKK